MSHVGHTAQCRCFKKSHPPPFLENAVDKAMIDATPRTVITCPVDGCEWKTENSPPALEATPLAGVFGLGVMTAIGNDSYRRELEERIATHLNTHAVLDWVKTIKRLEAELAGEKLRAQLTHTGGRHHEREQVALQLEAIIAKGDMQEWDASESSVLGNVINLLRTGEYR